MRIQGRTAATVTRGTLLAVVVIAGTGTAALGATPANDDRGAAKVVGDLPFRDSLDTTDATRQPNDPDCFSDEVDPTVWYSFTPGTDARFFASTAGSDYDTTLVVATSGPDGLEVVRCNDDWIDGSLVAWAAKAGQEYLIMVGSYSGVSGGGLEFRVRRVPPRPSFTLSLGRSGTINRHGAAVVHGLLRCHGRHGRHSIDVIGRQDAGRLRIRGFGFTDVRCGVPFRVRVRSGEFRFGPGTMSVRAAVQWCTAVHCGVERAERAVRIR
jgi:hypothetical protein